MLHHTADAAGGVLELCKLVKSGGYVIIGLYNRYGRLLLDLRRWLLRVFGDRLARLDYFMRRGSWDTGKRKVWFMDQYRNPYEQKFTVDHVLEWFRQNRIAYVNSLPRISPMRSLGPVDQLFEPHPPGGKLDHFLSQLSWIVTQGREGGLFIMIGRKL